MHRSPRAPRYAKTLSSYNASRFRRIVLVIRRRRSHFTRKTDVVSCSSTFYYRVFWGYAIRRAFFTNARQFRREWWRLLWRVLHPRNHNYRRQFCPRALTRIFISKKIRMTHYRTTILPSRASSAVQRDASYTGCPDVTPYFSSLKTLRALIS